MNGSIACLHCIEVVFPWVGKCFRSPVTGSSPLRLDRRWRCRLSVLGTGARTRVPAMGAPEQGAHQCVSCLQDTSQYYVQLPWPGTEHGLSPRCLASLVPRFRWPCGDSGPACVFLLQLVAELSLPTKGNSGGGTGKWCRRRPPPPRSCEKVATSQLHALCFSQAGTAGAGSTCLTGFVVPFSRRIVLQLMNVSAFGGASAPSV